ncbi:MAG: serine/threonine-protein kinase [Polyangiales bacterium]
MEREFRREQAAIGKLAHAAPWLLFAVATVSIASTDALAFSPEQAAVIRAVRHALVAPSCLAAAAVALLPSTMFARVRELASTIAVAISVASVGFGIALFARYGLPLGDKPIMIANAVVTTVLVAAPALFSLRAVHHVAGTLVGIALFVACLSRHPALTSTQLAYTAFSTFASFCIGAVAAVQTERLRRSEFGERKKSEGLLKRELAHQVAARSRDLGEVLARLDAPTLGGKLSPGDRFDARYRIVRTLGAGGMGAVYEVERITDGQSFALKVITGHSSPARFAREAEIGARVHHPNVVPIVDVGVSPNGTAFLVMELVAGGSLEDRRARFGDPEWALPVLREIARGLSALHGEGVIHRDLKPGNVLLGEDERVRISDFGISRFGSSDDIDPVAETMKPLTGTGALLGTPLYMAPEAAYGGRTLDASADVFAFGILACEMLTGRAPFEVPAIMMTMAGRALPEPAFVSEVLEAKLAALILECLAEEPTRRPRLRTILERL